ncbi:MAG: hypothetical protein Tsb009_17660 [Planctomycetaceae bacterium]
MTLTTAGPLRSLPFLLVLVLVGCTHTPKKLWNSMSGNQYSDQTKLRVARVQEQQGQLDQAMRLYREVIAKDPKNTEALHRMAIVSTRLGDHQQAEQHFRAAIQLAPRNSKILADYGYALFLRKDLNGAEAMLKRSVNLDPSNRRAVNNLATVLGFQGRTNESLAMFRKVVDDAEAHANLAYVHVQKGEGKKAVQHYSQALSLDPKLRSASHAMVQLAEIEKRFVKSGRAPSAIAKSTSPQKPTLTPSNTRSPVEIVQQQNPTSLARTSLKKFPVRQTAVKSRTSHVQENVVPVSPSQQPGGITGKQLAETKASSAKAEMKSRVSQNPSRIDESHIAIQPGRRTGASLNQRHPAFQSQLSEKEPRVSVTHSSGKSPRESIFGSSEFVWAQSSKSKTRRNQTTAPPQQAKPFPHLASTTASRTNIRSSETRSKPSPQKGWTPRRSNLQETEKVKPAFLPEKKESNAVKHVGFEPQNRTRIPMKSSSDPLKKKSPFERNVRSRSLKSQTPPATEDRFSTSKSAASSTESLRYRTSPSPSRRVNDFQEKKERFQSRENEGNSASGRVTLNPEPIHHGHQIRFAKQTFANRQRRVSGRVKLTPAPDASQSRRGFQLLPTESSSSQSGRVKMAPETPDSPSNTDDSKGRVRLNAM